MWPIDQIRSRLDRRRRLAVINTILSAAEAQNIHLAIGGSRFGLERTLLSHESVETLSNRHSRRYRLSFLIGELEAVDAGYRPEFRPVHPLPPGYFREPIGFVPNPDFDSLSRRYETERSDVLSAMVEARKRSVGAKMKELEAQLTSVVREEPCSLCDGEGGRYRSLRHPVSGDFHEDYFEEEWADCRVCGGTGTVTTARYAKLREDKRQLEQSYSVASLEPQVTRELAKRRVVRPAKDLPVHLKVLGCQPSAFKVPPVWSVWSEEGGGKHGPHPFVQSRDVENQSSEAAMRRHVDRCDLNVDVK